MRRRDLFFLPGLVLAMPAHGHRANFSLTDLCWWPDRRVLEVTHSIHLDDAMVLLASLGAPDGSLAPEIQARLMLYLGRHFVLTAGERALTLQPIGVRIDGEYLWLYQELKRERLPESLQVRCTLMQDFAAEQTNQVDFRVGDEVKTLRLSRAQQQGQLF